MPISSGSHADDAPRRRAARAACCPSPRAFAADVTTTAAAPSTMPDALPAVTEPSFAEGGRQRREPLERRVRPHVVVLLDADRLAPGLDLDRHDLLREAARRPRRGRALLRARARRRPAPRA